MGVAVDAVRLCRAAGKQAAAKEVLPKPGCPGWVRQTEQKMLGSDATVPVKCIGARPRVVGSP